MVEIEKIDAWLAEQEAQVSDLREGVNKRVEWAGKPGVKTDVSLVYVHGFSASSEEVRPVTDEIAKTFGANVYYARLPGHGRSDAAMGEPTVDDWVADTKEAIEIGQLIGDKVVLMGCSTGCPLIHIWLSRGVTAAAAVYLSPNFGVRNLFARIMLSLPGVASWGPKLVGEYREFEVMNDGHRKYWTWRHPTKAVIPMRDSVNLAYKEQTKDISTPIQAWLNKDDTVINPTAARSFLAPLKAEIVDLVVSKATQDNGGHLLMGDVFAPEHNAEGIEGITQFLKKVL